MELVWTERSRDHLQQLYDYLAAEDPAVAQKLVARIIDVAETILTNHPQSGRLGRITKTRELVITGTPYVLAYTVKNDVVYVVAIWHTARRWPKHF